MRYLLDLGGIVSVLCFLIIVMLADFLCRWLQGLIDNDGFA